MDAAVAILTTKVVQAVLLTIATIFSFTAFLWPDSSNVEDGSIYDIIVIGAGTAGSVLANRLSENKNCRILIIEAGGDPPLESQFAGLFSLLPRTKYDWDFVTENDGYTSQAHKDDALYLTAGKMLGGSSSINHVIYSRGFPDDYNHWANIVNDDSWNYTNIFKYLQKSEKLQDPAILASEYKSNHGLNGNIGTTREPHPIIQKYLDAIKEVGYDVILDTVGDALAFSQLLFTIANGVRQSTAYGYLHPIKDERDNLEFLKEATVTKIIFGDNKVANGVTVVTKAGKNLTLKARKEIILSAGAFNSPKLLMLSGIGPKSDLTKLNIPVLSDLPVGYNLQDHVGIFMVHTVGKIIIPPLPPNPTQFPLAGMVGYVALNESQRYPDYQALNFLFRSASIYSQICSFLFSIDNKICDNMNKALEGTEMYVSLPSLLHPNSRGRVQLRSTDPNDKPIIKTGFFSDKSDLDKMVAIIKDNLRVEDSSYFKSVNSEFVDPKLPKCALYEFKSEDYWKCYILNMASSIFHYTSTCSMGSVVDSQLNVIGVKGLRVVDASVMPTIPSGNTMAPVIMVAEKAADMINNNYRDN